METRLLRDCSATIIPEGTAITLEKDTPVYVTQTLGGNVTVRVGQTLYRISNFDVEAIEGVDLGDSTTPVAISADGEFSELSVWEALKQCFDPEIPVNIVDLGLIYDLRIDELDGGKKEVAIKMTLTAQGCGMGPVIAQDAKNRVEQLDEVENADVQIVWEPVWSPQMISEAGKLALGLD
jgi:probable FeS assembly SUF system protein SufT